MLISLVLFAMGAQSWALSMQCHRSTNMKFSVSSWRNESGHRLVAADVLSLTSDKDSVSLTVELLSEKCGDNRAVILKTLSSSGQPEEQAFVRSTAAPTQPEKQASVSSTVAPTQTEEEASVRSTVAPTQPEKQASVSSTVAPTQTQEEASVRSTVAPTQTEEEASVSSTVAPTQTEEEASVRTTVAPTQLEEQASVSSTVAPTQTKEEASVRTTVAPAVQPIPGYHHLSGFGYYKKLPNYMTWKDGVEACRKEGASMLLLETQEEIDAIYGWTGCCMWVGVHRENYSGPWINVLGQQMNSTDFFGWLPNYPKGLGNCMVLANSPLKKTINLQCDTTIYVVCEQML
ncbi:mucin-21 [Anabrus simplex]|uniref:mucin-21 n=1 Tax=Anabrus simplex TaxID=316456 RepID=UPI0035A35062